MFPFIDGYRSSLLVSTWHDRCINMRRTAAHVRTRRYNNEILNRLLYFNIKHKRLLKHSIIVGIYCWLSLFLYNVTRTSLYECQHFIVNSYRKPLVCHLTRTSLQPPVWSSLQHELPVDGITYCIDKMTDNQIPDNIIFVTICELC